MAKHISEIDVDGNFETIDGPVPDVQPKHPRRITLDQLDPSHHPLVKMAIAAARRWASLKIAGNDRVSMVLVATPEDDAGPESSCTGYGCGKTHIARAVQWASYTALDDGTPVAPAGRFYTAQDLIELVGAGNTMQELAPPPTEMADGGFIGGTPVLVIDDVGTEGVLKYVSKDAQRHEMNARYFNAINYCYEKHISIVLTANMSISQLARHIGGRAWSRLQEMAPKGLILDLTGVPDWRRKQGGR